MVIYHLVFKEIYHTYHPYVIAHWEQSAWDGEGVGWGGALNQFKIYSRETSPLIPNQLQIPTTFSIHTRVCVCTKCMTCLIPILQLSQSSVKYSYTRK